jgi:hypothetical protein
MGGRFYCSEGFRLTRKLLELLWYAWQGSNLRPSVPETLQAHFQQPVQTHSLRSNPHGYWAVGGSPIRPRCPRSTAISAQLPALYPQGTHNRKARGSGRREARGHPHATAPTRGGPKSSSISGVPITGLQSEMRLRHKRGRLLTCQSHLLIQDSRSNHKEMALARR